MLLLDEVKKDYPSATRRSPRSANAIDCYVGRRVRMRRIGLAISQENLAKQLGITFQQLQKYESGVNRIVASRLYELGSALGVPVQYFYDEWPAGMQDRAALLDCVEIKGDSSFFELLDSHEGRELYKALAQITNPNVLRAITALIKSIGSSCSEAETSS